MPGLIFHADIVQTADLHRRYQEIADFRTPWPPPTLLGTWEVTTLNCTLQSKYGTFRLFDLTFVEYSGELISRGRDAGLKAEELMQRLGDAHALLFMIDGHKLLRYLQGDGDASGFLKHDMYLLYQQAHVFDGPVHFVITKWDLLEGHFQLSEVRDRLSRAPEAPWLGDFFRSRAGAHRWRGVRFGPARLLPVSALGGFAELSPDGIVRKAKHRPIQPWNVEMPMLSALPDIAHWALASASLQEREEARSRRRRRQPTPEGSVERWTAGDEFRDIVVTTTFNEFLVVPAVSFLFGAVFGPVPRVLLGSIVSEGVRRALQIARQAYRSGRPRSLRGVRSQRAALYYAIRLIRREVRRNQRRYKASVL